MEFLLFLKANSGFLNLGVFSFMYGFVIFLNPLAMLPQLLKAFKAKKEELGGVSIPMFFIFLTIQIMIALGAIKTLDTVLFASMGISALLTAAIILVTAYRKR